MGMSRPIYEKTDFVPIEGEQEDIYEIRRAAESGRESPVKSLGAKKGDSRNKAAELM